MNTPEQDKKSLLDTLIVEAADVDLICYLVRTEGQAVLRDLLQSVADAYTLSPEDIRHNLQVIREKKLEASGHPMFAAIHRLLHPEGGDCRVRAHSGVKGSDISGDLRLH